MNIREANKITKIRVICKGEKYYIKVKVKGKLFWRWVDDYSVERSMGIHPSFSEDRYWQTENNAIETANELSAFVTKAKAKMSKVKNGFIADIDIKTPEKDPEHFI